MATRHGSFALFAALLACDGGEPMRGPPGASAESTAPGTIAAPEAPATPQVAKFPLGWWRGDHVCLELFASGDFELSVQGPGPKVLIFGGARLTAAGPDEFSIELTVAKIWRGRWLSSCRKHHELGGWAESEDALGVQVTPGGIATLKLRRAGDDAIELCGERCETLRREAPALRGRWRRAGLENLSRPDPPWAIGELLELNFEGHSSHLWAGAEGAQRGTAYGEAVVTSLGDERFRVAFTPRRFADSPPTLFGAPLIVEQPRTLTLRRLAGQKLEACEGARCATLERQFDPHNYAVK